MTHGECQCGEVSYVLRCQPRLMYHCHCGVCRAASGASFVTNLLVLSAHLDLEKGPKSLAFHQSSATKRRYFCRSCGSPVYSQSSARPEIISLRSGTLKTDPIVRPSCHAYVKYKAPWVDILDGLPQHPDAIPDGVLLKLFTT